MTPINGLDGNSSLSQTTTATAAPETESVLVVENRTDDLIGASKSTELFDLDFYIKIIRIFLIGLITLTLFILTCLICVKVCRSHKKGKYEVSCFCQSAMRPGSYKLTQSTDVPLLGSLDSSKSEFRFEKHYHFIPPRSA